MTAYTGYDPISWNSLEIINRQVATDRFKRLNDQALLVNFWNRITGRPKTLLSYEHAHAGLNGITNRDLGVASISMKSIVGSLNRAEDYDRQFRPRNPALKDRWVNVYMLSESVGWEPITVHKVGDQYFVEDGHHRVSVARHMGLDTIEAHIYE